ncbi:MAG: disulfide reductase, partial [Desulfobacterales bacterium]|nr:disulfide reductase [Desulfobacterales bacterium]
NSSLREEINAILAEEGLQYEAGIDIMHLLTVLYKEVGLQAIKEKMTRRYENLKVATHYGCHALRPSQVTQFDDPVAPTLFDELVNITGAKSIEWAMKLECCGGPLLGVNDELSFVFRDKKLLDAKKAGADYLTTGCPYCQIQFDTVQNHHVPSILYSQLLGLCLGLDKETLGFDSRRAEIENFLAS